MKKYNKKALIAKRATIVLITVFFLGGLLMCVYLFIQYFNPFANQGSEKLKAFNQISATITDSVTNVDNITVNKTENDMHIGQLILVNNKVEYKFLEENQLKKLYDNKTSDYKISNKETLLNSAVLDPLNTMLSEFKKNTNYNDLLVASCYRSKQSQTTIMNNTIEQSGASQAAQFVAKPGCSEHHTGYAIDFSIYTDTGETLDYTGDGKCKWLNQNCYRYGFVVRYTTEKEAKTGYANEPWHFRYVGKPHAYVMKQNKFCFEEYIDYLKKYPYYEQHLKVTDDENNNYEIYYVKAKDGSTPVPVQKNRKYTISGNNIDGFIVTVAL
jgi:D-alanyl-D-alanine carboxypeptidase